MPFQTGRITPPYERCAPPNCGSLFRWTYFLDVGFGFGNESMKYHQVMIHRKGCRNGSIQTIFHLQCWFIQYKRLLWCDGNLDVLHTMLTKSAEILFLLNGIPIQLQRPNVPTKSQAKGNTRDWNDKRCNHRKPGASTRTGYDDFENDQFISGEEPCNNFLFNRFFAKMKHLFPCKSCIQKKHIHLFIEFWCDTGVSI